jgi:hypothetical protein
LLRPPPRPWSLPVATVDGGVHAALSVLDEIVGAWQAAGEAELVGLSGHLGGNARGDGADVGEGREDEPLGEVLLGDLLRQRLRGGQHSAACHRGRGWRASSGFIGCLVPVGQKTASLVELAAGE